MNIRTPAFVTLLLAFCSGHAQAQNDHLECYKIKDPVKLQAFVNLNSPQFGVAPNCKVGKAKFFCVPADKTVLSAVDKATKLPITPLPVTGPNPGDRICYKVKCPEPYPPDTVVTDQFGTRTVTKFKTSMLCAPAVKGTQFCGDGVKNGTEACDGGDDDNCPGACQTDCTCPCPATPTPMPTATVTATPTPGPPSCTDGIQNGGETDVDCGGATACPRCPDGDSCFAGSDCLSGTCSGGMCVTLGPNGAPCVFGGQCQSGFCTDSVCCNVGCFGSCQACSAAKKGGGIDGTCGFIGAGLDPDSECPGAQTCDGAGGCL